MPSYLGSKVQPSPGISLPMLAYIGSSAAAVSRASVERSGSSDAAVDATLLDFFAGAATVDDFDFFGSRLLRQTRLLPPAISSIVRPDSTDVMFSATTS